MTYEVRRFDLGSVFKISLLVYLVIGLVMGLFYSLILSRMVAVFSTYFEGAGFEGMESISGVGLFFMGLFMAVFFAVVWSILTVVAAAVYNLLASSVGGIKVELAQPASGYPLISPPYSPPAAAPPQPGTEPPTAGGI